MQYIVKPGDSLSKISQKYGISWRDLYNANKNVIGSNPNLIYAGQKYNIPGQSAPAPKPVAPKPAAPTVTPGTSAGDKASLTPWDEVLPFNQYFDEGLARSDAAARAASFYVPQAVEGRRSIESDFANRGLTRSGMRGQNVSKFYGDLGQQHQVEIEQDYLNMLQEAQQERNMMQSRYEESMGKERPATTEYEGYGFTPPETSAGRYGTSYLNWLNNITNR